MGLLRWSDWFSVSCYGVVKMFRVVFSRLLWGCQWVPSCFHSVAMGLLKCSDSEWS